MTDVLPRWARVLAAMGAGALCMGAIPPFVEGLTPTVPVMWWFARTSGLLAYVALWLTMMFGVLVASRGGGGWLDNGAVFELHKAWSVVAVVATGCHVLGIVADPHAGVAVVASVLPFASARLTGAVALGTFAGWGLLAVVVATVVRARLPGWVWRAVHAASFGTFLLALVHGVVAGTDTPTVQMVYAGTGTVLLSAVLHRLALASRRRLEARRTS